MFTMAKIKASGSSFGGRGKSFYHEHLSCNDYYNEKEKVTGYWKGRLTGAFDLTDQEVRDREFSLFQQNINPKTGKKLTLRTNLDGIRFFDFQCSAQKSVSIMAMVAGDNRLLEAHFRGVDLAMSEMEKFAAVRVREGNFVWSNNLYITGNIIFAQYHHTASRNLDPQLHTHNVVVNCTYDPVHRQLRALSEYEMCKIIRYAGKVYQNYMAAEALRLGYDIEEKRDKNGQIEGFEIKGITDEMMQIFSSRRAEIEKRIEEFLQKEGRRPSRKEIDVIARETRDRKLTRISDEEVHELQEKKLTGKEIRTIKKIRKGAENKKGFQLPQQYSIQGQINKVCAHLFERKSVVSSDQIMAEVLNQNLGLIDLQTLKKALMKNDKIIELPSEELSPLFAHKDNVRNEIFILDAVVRGKDYCTALNLNFTPYPAKIGKLDFSHQQKAVRSLLKSSDRFMLFQGSAGVGKTSALHELCHGISEGENKNIILIAPTNSAVAVLEHEGMKNCHTVARFLHDPELNSQAANAVLIVDEASLNSVKQGALLLEFAEKNNCRIIFVGDVKQHTSVEAGDFFRLLGAYTGIKKVKLSDIHRQRSEDYRAAIKSIAEGKIEDAFSLFDSKGWIIEGKGQYLKNAADDFLRLTDNGNNLHKCIAVSPTNRECGLITEEIRSQLKEKGIISKKGLKINSFQSFKWSNIQKHDIKNYQPGQEVCFIKSPFGIDVSIGQTGKIRKRKGNEITLDNGLKIDIEKHANQIEIGQTNEIELCKGDLVMFSVNDKKRGIVNGNFALVDDHRQLKLFDKKGNILNTIKMDKNFSALKYGFVTTSHKSQGQTKENVVIAAEQMDQKAFYVASSRGKENMRLHCPDKKLLHDYILKMPGDRDAALDIRNDLKNYFENHPHDEQKRQAVLKRKARVLADYYIKIRELQKQIDEAEQKNKRKEKPEVVKDQGKELVHWVKEVKKLEKQKKPAVKKQPTMEMDHDF